MTLTEWTPLAFSRQIIASNLSDLSPEELTSEAIDRAEAAADPAWKILGLLAIRQLCDKRDEFCSDDVWSLLPQTRENRALGSLLRAAQEKGWCRPTSEYRASSLPQQHRRPIRVWKSLVTNLQNGLQP